MVNSSLHWKPSLAKVPGLKLHVPLLALVWGAGGQACQVKQSLCALVLICVRGITVSLLVVGKRAGLGLLKRHMDSVQTGGISNSYLGRVRLKDANSWTWRYCLYEHLSLWLSCADEGSAVTCLQPCSALSTWIFFTGRFPELGSWRAPTGDAHLVLVKPSLQCADNGLQRCTVSSPASWLWGRYGLAVPRTVSCQELLPASWWDAGVGDAGSVVASDLCSWNTHETNHEC